jgi:L-rhamnonate dehydratase
MAEEAGLDLVPHSWLTHLLTGYSLQLIAALPRARLVEFNVSQSLLTRGVTSQPFALDEDGCVQIPDMPGSGVEVDEAFVREHRVS